MDEQQRSVRPGGEAKGGNAPQPGDPSDPERAKDRSEPASRDMQEHGFGDHKGSDQGGGDMPSTPPPPD